VSCIEHASCDPLSWMTIKSHYPIFTIVELPVSDPVLLIRFYKSQSSNANARTPNTAAASPAPPARLSVPLRTNLTRLSSSEFILSMRSIKSPSAEGAIEYDGSSALLRPNSLPSSGSESSSEVCSVSIKDWENPIIFRRCFLCRRLRCRLVVMDCREIS